MHKHNYGVHELRHVNTCMHTYTGTYNNQYMVLDMKKVELKKAIQDGALWVVEQIPGYAQ